MKSYSKLYTRNPRKIRKLHAEHVNLRSDSIMDNTDLHTCIKPLLGITNHHVQNLKLYVNRGKAVVYHNV